MKLFNITSIGRKAKFVIKKAKSGDTYFVFKAKNGQTLVTSEMYKSKQSAYKGISSLMDAILRNGKEIIILDET